MPNFDNSFDAQMLLASDRNYDPSQKQCPVVLIVDTSYSMNDMMDELNAGVRELKETIMNDAVAPLRVNLAIVEMGNAHATLTQEFTTVPSWNVKEYTAGGVTPMGEAVDLAMEHITNAKAMYIEEGTSYYRPWLIVFSDGIPTDSEGYFDTHWEDFAYKLKTATDEKHLICFTFYIGKNTSSDAKEMAGIKKAKEVLYTMASEIKGTKYSFQLSDGSEQLKEIFQWLSMSVCTIVNENDNLPAPPASQIPTSIFD